MSDLKDFLPYTSEQGVRGSLTISVLPPEGIPTENQEWIMIGNVDAETINPPPPGGGA